MYAQLCKRLSEEAPNFEPPNEPNTFRKLLLNNCKEEFENRSEALNKKQHGLLTADEIEQQSLIKRKMLGNIKFIGELGKLEILSEGILHRCIQTLLSDTRKTKTQIKDRDISEDIECLAQIMRTCGRILDSDRGRGLMEQYFERMKFLAENQDLQLRIRFMLKDVIDLRRDGWVPRKATTTEGPMPINQIRADEKIRSYMNNQMNRPSPNAGLDGLFRNPLKTRGGLDDVLGVNNFPSSQQFMSAADSFKGFGSNNGYHQNNSYRGMGNNNRSNGVYYQNRQHNNNNNFINNKPNSHYNMNNSGSKDLPPRFKKSMMLGANPGAPGAIEDISLRPATFKPPQPKPVQPLASDLFPGRNNSLIPDSLLTPPQLTQMVKEPPILIKQASSDKGKAGKKDKGPNKEEILKKVSAVLQDHLNIESLNDCTEKIQELKIPERYMAHVVLRIFNDKLDSNDDEERNLAMQLVIDLKTAGVLTNEKFLESYRELIWSMSERETNIPLIHSYVAKIGCKAITSELTTLAQIGELTDNGLHYPLFMLLLQALHEQEGKTKLTQLFNESKINLLNQVNEADRTKERLSDMLAERDLTFLFPLSSIQSSLWKQLQADPNPTQFYKWIKENLDTSYYTNPGFINALVTVVLKYIYQTSKDSVIKESAVTEGSDAVTDKALSDKERSLLEKYKPVLQAFLHERQDLQVTAVYSLQVLCYSLQFPKGMLLRWFLHLYDLEIVEEEAFLKWKEDLTDDYPGKGKALFQVNQWLTWLAEAESEEEEEDETEN